MSFSHGSRQALKWGLGVTFVVPVTSVAISVVQGVVLLNDYRVNHRDAPRPIIPASGVAIAVKKSEDSNFWNMSKNYRQQVSERGPLRILVVGDSLAAGVGISKSGTPVLPDSMARALSKAHGGRPVYWTCIGTPGISTSQIVQDIHQLEPYKEGNLERLVTEFQTKRRRWIERQERIRSETADRVDTNPDSQSSGIHEKLNKGVTHPQNPFLEWWKQVSSSSDKSPSMIFDTTKRVAVSWFTQVKTRVQEDVHDLRTIATSDLDEVRYPGDTRSETREEPATTSILQKGIPFLRRNTLNPAAVAEYDIAIILTGVNDLKDRFLPFMMRGENSSTQNGTERIEGGLKEQLREIVGALKDKMGDMDLETASQSHESIPQRNEANDDVPKTGQKSRGPLIVLPALPVAPLTLLRVAPLRWFLAPLFDSLDEAKKSLANAYPGLVLYIPQPSEQFWIDVEAGRGPIREGLDNEKRLFQSNDASPVERLEVKQNMKEHYEAKALDAIQLEDASNSEEEVVYTAAAPPGASLLAVDGIHPNDEGYEVLGHYLVQNILKHWERSRQEL